MMTFSTLSDQMDDNYFWFALSMANEVQNIGLRDPFLAVCGNPI